MIWSHIVGLYILNDHTAKITLDGAQAIVVDTLDTIVGVCLLSILIMLSVIV